jgi:hypothetical protein
MSIYPGSGNEQAPQAIVPVRPTTSATTAPASGTPAGLLRRTLGGHFPSRRTLGGKFPSRRTLGGRFPSRRTLGGRFPSRRTLGYKTPSRRTLG